MKSNSKWILTKPLKISNSFPIEQSNFRIMILNENRYYFMKLKKNHCPIMKTIGFAWLQMFDWHFTIVWSQLFQKSFTIIFLPNCNFQNQITWNHLKIFPCLTLYALCVHNTLTIRGKKTHTHKHSVKLNTVLVLFLFEENKTIEISIVSNLYLFICLFTVGVENSINSRLQNTNQIREFRKKKIYWSIVCQIVYWLIWIRMQCLYSVPYHRDLMDNAGDSLLNWMIIDSGYWLLCALHSFPFAFGSVLCYFLSSLLVFFYSFVFIRCECVYELLVIQTTYMLLLPSSISLSPVTIHIG